MSDDRPAWAVRIRAERTARRWSQADAVRALRTHGPDSLPGQDSLLRSWKRWESGDVEPDEFYKPLIALTFGTVTAALFPRHDRHDNLAAGTGMDTLELVARLRASDVSATTIEALRFTAEWLACEYPHMPPEELLVEGHAWLRRLTGLLDRRLTLAQHREVLALAGEVSLLVGCVEYDMGQRQAAEATRRAALALGEEAGEAGVVGWAHEMRAWYALTQGDYATAIGAAEAGLTASGPHLGVAVQLAAHRAKAWARLGDRRQVEVALDQGRAILEALPTPDNPANHFVVDPSKWDFYTMDAYRHIGDDRLAETYAREVLSTSTNPDGSDRRPMRAAEARITLAVVAARGGDLDEALTQGRLAVASTRQSLPSLLMCSRELAQVLTDRHPNDARVAAFLEELRAL